MERVMRIGFYILAVALIGGPWTQASLAEDAPVHTTDGATTSATVPPTAPTPGGPSINGNGTADGVTKPDDHGPGKTTDGPANGGPTPPTNGQANGVRDNAGTATGQHSDVDDHAEHSHGDTVDKDNAHAGSMKDLGPIDARIAPPSHRFGRPVSNREAKSKVNVHSTIAAHPRPTNKHRIAVQPTRNSVGLVVPPQNANPGHDVSLTASHNPGLGPSVVAPVNAPADAVRTEPGAQQPVVVHQNFSPAVTAPVANSGAVNGTGFVRHGVGPAAVAGQTKVIAGISGTMVHPKH
jgi:hypothetical protein